MNLKCKTLVDWLKKKNFKMANGNIVEFYSKYAVTREHLNKNYYNDISLGAIISNNDMVLNDHGQGHIDTVIYHASRLVEAEECLLSVYEVYLLLIAILFHDLGNIEARDKHEEIASDIMDSFSEKFSEDQLELRIIKQLVYAHGGKKNDTNDKDKILDLREIEQMIYGQVRLRLLAAILRFADELADDKNRACKGLMELEKVSDKSIIYHAYSSCLNTPLIDHKNKSIVLNFDIHEKYIEEKFFNNSIFLLDEIYSRVLKMHLERIYCMRFAKPFIFIDKIVGQISFYGDKQINIPRISFELFERGYPNIPSNNIFDLCPNLILESGIRFDGEYYFERYGKKVNQDEVL